MREPANSGLVHDACSVGVRISQRAWIIIMYDTTFDAEQAELSRRDRRALWMLRIAAIAAVVISASLEGQIPGAPATENQDAIDAPIVA